MKQAKQERVGCPYCSRHDYYDTPAKGLGNCSCGHKRYEVHDIDADDCTVKCLTCGKVSEQLTARVNAEYTHRKCCIERINEHIAQEHRNRILLDRITEIEREARHVSRYEQFTDADWRDHPLAVEYRALLKEWWTIPTITIDDYLNSPTRNRSLTSAKQSTQAPDAAITRGRNKLIKQAKVTGERRFKVGETEYRLWFDEPKEVAV